MTHGISFPAGPDGSRSTTATARAVVADALRPVDPVGARSAEQETNWRSGYVAHFRRLVEAGVPDPEAWTAIARAGLDGTRQRMVVASEDGDDRPLASLQDAAPGRELATVAIVGEGDRVEELVLPYRGARLRGAELQRQLDVWQAAGVLEPSAVDAVREVLAHPEWLRLDGHTVAVLGAAAEMGPLTPLLSWGATVAAVDLPAPALWDRVRATARSGAGRLLVPVAAGTEEAGADLLAEVPAVGDWVAGLDGDLVVGNYLYADGGTHVRVSMAADALATRVTAARPGTMLAFLATPTDVFVVPPDAVEQANRAYDARRGSSKLVGRPLRWVSRGRLLHRQYPPPSSLPSSLQSSRPSSGRSDAGTSDCLVPQQGPNYALAKRLQRWRAAVARHDGQPVSFHVAPSTRTRSVLKNRALAAAFAGAHRFGVEVFDPATSNTLMAALLVHDIAHGTPTHAHPWQDEAYAAVHGGIWRAAYEPRSALGLAAVLGYAGARG